MFVDANATLTLDLISRSGQSYLRSYNGLKTATVFDYETNASAYSIRVQAKDEFNA